MNFNNIHNVHNIVIAPHRDDAFLTFGGTILNALENRERVTIYVIYGTDGYLREEFKNGIKKGDKFIYSYLEKNRRIAGFPAFSNDLFSLIKNAKTSLDWAKIGIIIRKLEERAACKTLGIRLNEYNLPSAFPLRGYKSFNSKKSSIFDNDINIQLSLLAGSERYINKDVIEKLRGILKSFSTFYYCRRISLVRDLIKEIKTPRIKYKFYFPAGIGGHPDHIILAKFAYIFSRIARKKGTVSIYLGQDIPYSVVLEWVNFSPFKLYNLEKIIISIERNLEKKIQLLKGFYYSQFSVRDVYIIKKYHKFSAELINNKYYKSKYSNKKPRAVEILYKIL